MRSDLGVAEGLRMHTRNDSVVTYNRTLRLYKKSQETAMIGQTPQRPSLIGLLVVLFLDALSTRRYPV